MYKVIDTSTTASAGAEIRATSDSTVIVGVLPIGTNVVVDTIKNHVMVVGKRKMKFNMLHPMEEVGSLSVGGPHMAWALRSWSSSLPVPTQTQSPSWLRLRSSLGLGGIDSSRMPLCSYMYELGLQAKAVL